MAPVVAEATGAAVMALLLSVSPAVAMGGGRQGHGNGASQPQRGRRRPVMKVLAWGQRGGLGSSSSSQVEMDPNRPSPGRGGGGRGGEGGAEECTDYPKDRVVDDSWTHAAFKAFHEMRAGQPLSTLVLDEEEEEEEQNEQGPLVAVRRLASRLTRAARGQEDGDAGKQRQQLQQGSPLVQTADEKDAHDSEATNVDEEKQIPPACWHMRGRLTNAATGQTIALVEGVELSRNLAFETAQSEREKRRAQKKEEELLAKYGKAGKVGGSVVEEEAGEELEVDKALKPGVWTAFGSLASKKFFMYQDPETGDPMEHFRNTPVEKKQVVRTYERFSQIVSHLLQPNGRVLVISEWGGRSVQAETANSNGVEEMGEDGGSDFFGGGGFRKGKGKGSSERASPPSSSPRRVFNLHFFVEARTPKEERELKRWQDRPGARWIAFGSPPPPAHGCKEAYSYVSGGADKSEGKPTRGKGKGAAAAGGGGGGGGSPSSSRGGGGLMSYTRYGECPTWYGTGRMCGLDVQAKRVDSFESLPKRLREKVREVDPEFEVGPPATMEECRLAAKKEREDKEEERRRRGKRSLRRPLGSWGSSSGVE